MEKEKNMDIFMVVKFQVQYLWPYLNSNPWVPVISL